MYTSFCFRIKWTENFISAARVPRRGAVQLLENDRTHQQLVPWPTFLRNTKTWAQHCVDYSTGHGWTKITTTRCGPKALCERMCNGDQLIGWIWFSSNYAYLTVLNSFQEIVLLKITTLQSLEPLRVRQQVFYFDSKLLLTWKKNFTTMKLWKDQETTKVAESSTAETHFETGL